MSILLYKSYVLIKTVLILVIFKSIQKLLIYKKWTDHCLYLKQNKFTHYNNTFIIGKKSIVYIPFMALEISPLFLPISSEIGISMINSTVLIAFYIICMPPPQFEVKLSDANFK